MKLFQTVICIGTSTGGPGALERVLTRLPEDFPAPLFIVQHMPKTFTKALADRLDAISAIRVKEAEEGDKAEPGAAYIAPGGKHMKVGPTDSGVIIKLDSPNSVKGHCPSVNELFKSATTLKDYRKVAVIMTGMGSDGTEGLRLLKAAGKTLAITESEISSVVFGMPKSAGATGMVDIVLHVDHIAEHLMKIVMPTRRS
ncbi:MAG TPA: CheB methylesterase domain-containing protein [Bacillales bacterium]|nr:CheB methylesterase domain-containing protein [Bacillales bacterium]